LTGAEATYDTESSSNTAGANVGTGIDVGMNGVAVGPQASVSVGAGKSNQTVTHQVNSHISGTGTVAISSGNDTNLKGAVVSGNTVIANVGGDLNIESIPDTATYDEKNTGGSIGLSTSGLSGGVNQSKVEGDYSNVTEQSGIVAGEGGYHIAVGNGVDLKGGVIASTADEDKNTLTADHLTYSDVENHSKASSSSMGVSLTPSGLPVPSVGRPAKETDSGVAKATITPGNLTLTNQQQDLSGLNTDLSNANTQVEQYDIERLKAKQESAAAFSELMNMAVGEVSARLGFADGTAEKVAMHAAAGALTAILAGGNAGVGALAGGAQELIGAVINQALMDNPNMTQEERNALSQWAAVVVGGIVGGQTGAATALDAETYNRQLHIDEAKLIAANAAQYAVQRGYCQSAGECSQTQIDMAISELVTQAVKQTDITGKDYAQNDAASAFLDSIAPKGGIPYICSDGAKDCGQTWFHASGEQYRDSTINSNFLEQTAKYYNTASGVYNKEHLGQIDIAGSLYQNAQTIAGVNQAMTAVDQGMLPWEVFNGIFAGVGGPFAVNAPSKSNTGTATEAAPSGMRAYLGSKLEFLFGNASGTKKNIDRSQAMQSQLKSIGLNDDATTRSYVANHMNSILNDPSNIVRVQPDGRAVRESLLSGPTGIVKMETIWDGNKLITIKVFGGNP
jgi:filamentous hemagglutinin